MNDELAEARRVLAQPELLLSSHEWRRLVAGLVRVIEERELDELADQARQES